MVESSKQVSFQVVVSDKQSSKIGIGGTTTASESYIYYYAEYDSENVSIQLLNQHHLPAGEKISVPMGEFLKRYKPEPLIYFNQVLPAMEAVQKKIDKAGAHLKANRLEKAEATFKEVLAVSPNNIKSIFGLGVAYIGSGNSENATEVFEKIMSLELAFLPEHTDMFNEFGIKMRKVGMLDNALAYYNKALEVNEQDENLYFNLARVHYEMGNVGIALELLDKALGMAPEFIEAVKMKKFITK